MDNLNKVIEFRDKLEECLNDLSNEIHAIGETDGDAVSEEQAELVIEWIWLRGQVVGMTHAINLLTKSADEPHTRP